MSDPTEPAAPKPARTRLWVRLLLFASLALNLLIIGAIGGAVFNNRQKGDDRPAQLVRELGLGPYLRALDATDRQALRKAAEARKGELRQSRVALRRHFAETIEVLEAEELDQARLSALFAAQAEAAGKGREIGQELLAARIAGMSMDERQALAASLKKALRRPPPKHALEGRPPKRD